jgi:hypothetical protein
VGEGGKRAGTEQCDGNHKAGYDLNRASFAVSARFRCGEKKPDRYWSAPRDAKMPVISTVEVGYVRRSELSLRFGLFCPKVNRAGASVIAMGFRRRDLLAGTGARLWPSRSLKSSQPEVVMGPFGNRPTRRPKRARMRRL